MLERVSPLLVTVLFLFSAISFTTTAELATLPPITAFDQYGNLCWDDEQARLDNFAIQMQHSPDHYGDIIVYSGRLSCPDEAKYRADRAKKYVVKRGVRADRIQVRDGGYREDVQTILWLVPPGLKPVSLEPTLKKEQVSIRRRCVDKIFEKVICLNR